MATDSVRSRSCIKVSFEMTPVQSMSMSIVYLYSLARFHAASQSLLSHWIKGHKNKCNIVSETFLTVAGVRVLNRCNIFAVPYQWRRTSIRINCFSRKRCVTPCDNRILYSLSRLMLNRFAAIGSQYGAVSTLQPSVASIKVAVWNSFATDIQC